MKRITLAILMVLSSYTMASAELGLSVGVSGQVGVFHATGTDSKLNTAGTSTRSDKEDATAVVGFGSIFVEKTLPGALERVSIGIDYVPYALESDTVENVRHDFAAGGGTGTLGVDSFDKNDVQVDFENLTTAYLSFSVLENMYIKAGITQVDIKTNEKLATGSKYGDTSLDGTMVGLGFNKDLARGMFIRAEANYMEFGNAKLTSSTNSENTIKLDGLEGASGKISIGKTF